MQNSVLKNSCKTIENGKWESAVLDLAIGLEESAKNTKAAVK